MSLENGDQVLQESPAETEQEFQHKKSKILYTRDFLLSLSELDVCKKLPSGFDVSILSEFQDVCSNALERHRSIGGLSLQSTRHSDYGSLPPNRSESLSSYSHGSAGRWDTRSSGSSDRDGDLQSERDMQDSGRGFGNQPRRFWQHPEHDGLLGSGAFPRPSGYAGASAPRPRGNDHYQLNRSTEPYHPPRPYKAVPFVRKDNTDSVNDETFGSAELTSEDRVEEERKRRASFELMRKGQQKALQEKQNWNADNNKGQLDADILTLFEKSEDGKNKNKEEKSHVSVASSLLQNDSSRLPSHVQNPASRPLVPPGFASAILEKNLSMQSSSTSTEAGRAVAEDNSPQETDLDKKNNMTAGIKAFKDSVGLQNVSDKTTGLQKGNETWEGNVMNDLSDKNESESMIIDTVSQDHSTSILEKLFGGSVPKDKGSCLYSVEHQGVKADEETQDHSVTKSSKFAHWFLGEEEKGPAEDFSSRNLLSLIINNERGSQATTISDDKAIEHSPPAVACLSDEASQKLLVLSPPPPVREKYYQSDKRDSSSIVLTCEDLEQFMLAEAKGSSSSLQHSTPEPGAVVDDSSKEEKADVDDRASQHLLSLLQKGTGSVGSVSVPKVDGVVSVENAAVTDMKARSNIDLVESVSIKNSETGQGSEKTLTLEALFGAAFMNELQSVGAPVSAQRRSVGRIDDGDVAEPHGRPFAHADGGLVSSTGEYHFNKIIGEGNGLAFSYNQEAKSVRMAGISSQFEESSLEGSKVSGKGYEQGGLDIHLPEEDSLISVGEPLDPIESDPSFRNANRTENLLPNKRPEEPNDPLLNTILREGERMGLPGLGGPPHMHGPYNHIEFENLYHHVRGRRPPQVPQQTNHMRPLLPLMDHNANRNPQMKFMGPEGMQHDLHHHFPPNLLLNSFPNAARPRFDPLSHHPMLQHMPISENFPPQHPLQGLPRVLPLSHPVSHVPGYMAEVNNLHGFPLNHRQPNYGGPGMGIPGSVGGAGGGGNPEARQRLIEMELRANQKQIHPAAGHIPGIFGLELDMGFRYR